MGLDMDNDDSTSRDIPPFQIVVVNYFPIKNMNSKYRWVKYEIFHPASGSDLWHLFAPWMVSDLRNFHSQTKAPHNPTRKIRGEI